MRERERCKYKEGNKLRREMEKKKVESKEESSIEVLWFPESGPNLQYQSPPNTLSAFHHKMAFPITKLKWRKMKQIMFWDKHRRSIQLELCYFYLPFPYGSCILNSLSPANSISLPTSTSKGLTGSKRQSFHSINRTYIAPTKSFKSQPKNSNATLVGLESPFAKSQS